MAGYLKTIAVDFDGCLCTNKWPGIGEPNWDAIHALIMRQAQGDRLILWTCREGKQLEEAVQWCLDHQLKFDAVNENLPEHQEHFGNDCRKVYANEYWDDKAYPVLAFDRLPEKPVEQICGISPHKTAKRHKILTALKKTITGER